MSDSGLCRLCGGLCRLVSRARADDVRSVMPVGICAVHLCSRIGIRIWCVLFSGTIPTIAIRSCT
jgi:hypothetical protein